MTILIAIILGIIVLMIYFVGSYFVRYSLVPNSGAEKRAPTSSEDIADDETTTIAKQTAIENAEKDEALTEKWLHEMDWKTKEVTITSHDDLKLSGHSFEQPTSTNRWIILVHGYQSNENETFMIGRHFYQAGYNVLTIALRAHGGSEGKYIGMGYLDKEDLISWTNALVEKHPNSQIIYHGTSMGGATVLMASGMTLPKNVKAVISDCAYTKVWDIFASELKLRFSQPPFPILYMAQIMAKIQAGYNIKDGNVLHFVEQSSLPTLFIHTALDDFVPVTMADELYKAKTKGEKDLYILEDGGHAEAKFVDLKNYYAKINTFINQYI